MNSLIPWNESVSDLGINRSNLCQVSPLILGSRNVVADAMISTVHTSKIAGIRSSNLQGRGRRLHLAILWANSQSAWYLFF